MSLARSGRESLADHLLPLLTSLPLLPLVLLHSTEEVFPATRVVHMLNADIDALGNDAVPRKRNKANLDFHKIWSRIILLPNLLVEDDTHSSLGHVEHAPSLPVVKLVRHTLLKRTITLHTYGIKSIQCTRSTCEHYI